MVQYACGGLPAGMLPAHAVGLVALRKVQKADRHVPGYLVGEHAEPEELPGRGKPGSFHEAILVASSQRPAW